MLNYTRLAKLLLFLFAVELSFAQRTTVYDEPATTYKRGLELFEKEKYGAAQKCFKNVSELLLANSSVIKAPNSEIIINSEYYSALCALELFNRDAERLLVDFIKTNPANPNSKTACFQLGKYNFRKKRYKDVIEWFKKVDVYDLNNEELSEYYFKFGYSYFTTAIKDSTQEDFERARQMFKEIKDADSKFSLPAVYYYSHIAYLDKNYQTALEGFEKISENESFAKVVPYYITQIYYLQGKYEKLLDYAPSLLDSADTKRTPEIARLIGEAYYGLGKHDKAIPFLERYINESYGAKREDYYQLAYAYYKSENYEKAIDNFKRTVNNDDIITQNAYYHVGDCYLKTGKKKFARFAFRTASKFDFDKNIQEDAAYNNAKLSYETGINSIFALKTFIRDYPGSKYVDEVYELLTKVYLTTKDYRKALLSIESVQDKNEKLSGAYQRIAYYRGVELFNNGRYSEAIEHLDKSLKYILDKPLVALCHYWKGETFYRLNQFDKAIESYNQFIYAPEAITLPVFNDVNYNIGYANFKNANYPEAATWFRKFVRDVKRMDSITEEKLSQHEIRSWGKVNDAYIRTGDSYFMIKDYHNAIDFYSDAVKLSETTSVKGLKMMDTDYALFQKALASGVIGNQNQKTEVLQYLLSKYSSSAFIADAKFELARSYTVSAGSDKAVSLYHDILSNHCSSTYVKKSLLNLGLIFYNNNENEKALENFKKVVEEFPATPESQEALIGIRNVSVDMGDMDSYTSYISGLTFASVSQGSLDSATFEAAQLRYTKGDCQNAAADFGKYLAKFKQAYFALDANFYKAECEYKTADFENALAGYNYVTEREKNIFTEKSRWRAADILYSMKDYGKALEHYTVLQEIAEYKSNIIKAETGIMRCNYHIGNYGLAIRAAEKLLETDKVSNEIIYEAHYTIAKSALDINDYNLAFKEFKKTAEMTKSELGAEAKYNVAYIHYLRSEHEESEAVIFDLANQVPSYDYWVAKAFILLADNYVQTDNIFQAKPTLQSIIDNYERKTDKVWGQDEIIETATAKLNKILETEEAMVKEKLKKDNGDELKFYNETDINLDKLFQEESEQEE